MSSSRGESLAASTLIVADEILTPAQSLRHGWIRIDGRVIGHVAAGRPPAAGATTHVIQLPNGWRVVPGLVDMHVHGAGGGDLMAVNRAQIVEAGEALLSAGVTTTVASLVTAPVDQLEQSVDLIATLVEEDADYLPHFAGTHLEGPFLSVKQRGAHHVPSLQPPNVHLLERLVAAARDTIRMVTVAPELPGGMDFVAALADRGIVAALGHSDASHDETRRAIDRGITVATHLFNGMRRPHHREPGPAWPLVLDDRVTVELINDGHHVHPTAAILAVRASGDGKLAFISDAVVATNAPEGSYRLGGVEIRSQDGIVWTADGRSLGGGAVTLDIALRNAVGVLGVAVDAAVRATTSVPAAALGVHELAGTLAEGRQADLCILDPDLNVAGVMRAGRWIRHPFGTSKNSSPIHDMGVDQR